MKIFATAELTGRTGTSEPRRADFKVAFERPDKLRLEFYQGRSFAMARSGLPFPKISPARRFCAMPRKRLTLPMLQADEDLEPGAQQRFRRRVAAVAAAAGG